MFERFLRQEHREEAPIHPDFKIRDGFWWWNYTDIGQYAKQKNVKWLNVMGVIKVAFPFDDPALLDNCPFMCKIGANVSSSPDTKFFGIAYGLSGDKETMESWASRFPRHELITSTDETGETRERPEL